MKKQGLLAIILLSSSTASSALTYYDACPFDGPYLGASVGYSSYVSKITNNRQAIFNQTVFDEAGVVAFTSSETDNNFANPRGHKSSGIGSIYAGYGISCQNVYIGGEVFFSGAKRSARYVQDQPGVVTSTDPFSTTTVFFNNPEIIKVKGKNWEFGIDIRPGVLLTCDTLFYARLGFAPNRFRVTSFTSTTNTDPFFGPNYNVVLTGSARKTRLNPRYGAGLEQLLCDNLSIRLDYIFTHFHRLRINATTTSTANLPADDFISNARTIVTTLNDSVVAKAYNHSFMVGLNYYW